VPDPIKKSEAALDPVLQVTVGPGGGDGLGGDGLGETLPPAEV